jgi:ATP-dependent Clp protease ATP-binding subunit ClpC
MLSGYNFTERVRWALARAREEAAQLHHEYVGTEHILLGLLKDHEGVPAAVLREAAVDPDELRRRIESLVKRGKATEPTGPDLPYTSRAKKVLEFAMTEARELNHSYVGTQHLLLGLLREETGIAGQVLTEAGLSLSATREHVLRLIGAGSPEAPLPSATFGLTLGQPVAVVIRVRYSAGSIEWSFERKEDAIAFLESLPSR